VPSVGRHGTVDLCTNGGSKLRYLSDLRTRVFMRVFGRHTEPYADAKVAYILKRKNQFPLKGPPQKKIDVFYPEV